MFLLFIFHQKPERVLLYTPPATVLQPKGTIGPPGRFSVLLAQSFSLMLSSGGGATAEVGWRTMWTAKQTPRMTTAMATRARIAPRHPKARQRVFAESTTTTLSTSSLLHSSSMATCKEAHGALFDSETPKQLRGNVWVFSLYTSKKSVTVS